MKMSFLHLLAVAMVFAYNISSGNARDVQAEFWNKEIGAMNIPPWLLDDYENMHQAGIDGIGEYDITLDQGPLGQGPKGLKDLKEIMDY